MIVEIANFALILDLKEDFAKKGHYKSSNGVFLTLCLEFSFFQLFSQIFNTIVRGPYGGSKVHGFLSNFDSKVEQPANEEHTCYGDDVSNEIFLLKVFTLLSILFGLTGQSVQAEEVRGKIYATDEESEGNSAE